MPGALKLDHMQPIEPILFRKIFNFFTFIPQAIFQLIFTQPMGSNISGPSSGNVLCVGTNLQKLTDFELGCM